MSKASQFFGGGKLPLGSLVDFPSTAPSLITTDNMTFLRSGTTVNSDAYTDLPSAFKGKILHNLTSNSLSNNRWWPTFNTLGFIASDGGTNIVAHPGAASDVFAFSTDSGTTWWSAKYPYSVQVVSVVFFNGNFVFVHINGEVFYTTPTFSNSSPPTWGSISRTLTNYGGYVNRARVAGNKLYFLPTSYSTGITHQSTDRLSYTTDLVTVQKTEVISTALWNDVAYVGTRYVACYNDDNVTSGKLWWSANGVDGWTPSTTTINTSPIDAGGFGRIGQMYVAGSTIYVISEASTSSLNYYGWKYATTTDGNTVSLSGTMNHNQMTANDVPSGFFLNNRHYIGFSLSGYVMTSTKGSSWTLNPNPAANITQYSVRAGQHGQSVVFVNSTYHYLYAGSIQGAPMIYAATSPNLLTSHTVREWWGTKLYNTKTQVGSGGKIVSVQTGYGERVNQSLSSFTQSFATNGDNDGWGGVHAASMITREYLESSDYGVTWTKRKFPNTGWYSALCWTGTKFIALRGRRPTAELTPGTTLTNDNDIIHSADGITWTTVNAPTLNSTAYKWQYLLTDEKNPGIIIAVGRGWGSNVAAWTVSTDEGATWSTATTFGSYAFVHATVANNLTILVCVNSSNKRSLVCLDNNNPISWWELDDITANQAFSIVPRGSDFLIFGAANEPIIVDYGNLRSLSYQYTIGAIDPTNSNLVYAELDSLDSNIIHAWAGSNYYKSTNGGSTWTKYTTAFNFGNRGIISMTSMQNGALLLSDGTDIKTSSNVNQTYILNEKELSPTEGVIKYMRIA